MHKFTKALIWIAIFGAIAVLIAWPRIKPKADAPAPVAPSSNVLPVKAYEVISSTLQDKVKINGAVLPDETAELRAESPGRIIKINFKEGAPVKAGDLLVKINDAEHQADLRRLGYEIKLAVDIEARQKNLLARGTVSQEAYDRALNRLNTLRAELEVVKARILKTEIRAPFDGVIGFKYVSEGAYVTSSNPIARISRIDPVKIDFAIAEKYAGRVDLGDTIRFRVPGNENLFEGEVYAVEPRIDEATRSLPIRAMASNKDGVLIPGGFAQVELVFETIENALLIPTESLVPTLAGQKVWVYQNGEAVSREVTTGVRDERYIQVLSGLSVGDQVIRTGILQMRENLKVRLEGEQQ